MVTADTRKLFRECCACTGRREITFYREERTVEWLGETVRTALFSLAHLNLFLLS